MASIRKEIAIAARPGEVWAAIRDVGAVHQRLAVGFVTDTRMEDGVRVVTFANGFVARERIVDVDDETRRLAYAAAGGQLTHHNASFQVFADGNGGSRVVWLADLLPDELEPVIDGMMEQGASAMKETLGQQEMHL